MGCNMFLKAYRFLPGKYWHSEGWERGTLSYGDVNYGEEVSRQMELLTRWQIIVGPWKSDAPYRNIEENSNSYILGESEYLNII